METFSLKTNQPLDPATLASPDLLSDMSDIKMSSVLTSEEVDHIIYEESTGARVLRYNMEEVKDKFERVRDIQTDWTKNITEEDRARKEEHVLVFESVQMRNVPGEAWILQEISTESNISNKPTLEQKGHLSCLRVDTDEHVKQNPGDIFQGASVIKHDGKPRPPDIKKPIRKKLQDRERSGCSSSEGELERMSSEESLDGDVILKESTIVPTATTDPPASPLVVETPIGSVNEKVKALQNKVEEEKGKSNYHVQILQSTDAQKIEDMPELPKVSKSPKSPRSQTERLEETMSVKELMKAFQTGQDPSKNKSGLFEHKAVASACISTEKSSDSEGSLRTEQSPTLAPKSHATDLNLKTLLHESEIRISDKTFTEAQAMSLIADTTEESLLMSQCNSGNDPPHRVRLGSSEKETMSVKELMKAFQTGQDPSKSKAGLFEHKSPAPALISKETSESTDQRCTEEPKEQSQIRSVPMSDVRMDGYSDSKAQTVRSSGESPIISDMASFGEAVNFVCTIQRDNESVSPRREELSWKDQGRIQLDEPVTCTGRTLSDELQISPDRRPSEDFSADIKAELEESPEYQLFRQTSRSVDVSYQLEAPEEVTLVDDSFTNSSSIYSTDYFTKDVSFMENQIMDCDQNPESPRHENMADYSQISSTQDYNDTIEATIEEPQLQEVHISSTRYSQVSTAVKDMSGLLTLMNSDLDHYLEARPVASQPTQDCIVQEKFEQVILAKTKDTEIFPFGTHEAEVESGTAQETDFAKLDNSEAEEAVGEVGKSKTSKDDNHMLGVLSATNHELDSLPEDQLGASQSVEDILQECFEQTGVKDDTIKEKMSDGSTEVAVDEKPQEGDINEARTGGKETARDFEESSMTLIEESPMNVEFTSHQSSTQVRQMSGCMISLLKSDVEHYPTERPVVDLSPEASVIEERFEEVTLTKIPNSCSGTTGEKPQTLGHTDEEQTIGEQTQEHTDMVQHVTSHFILETPFQEVCIDRPDGQSTAKKDMSGMLSLLSSDLEQTLKDKQVAIQSHPGENVVHESCHQLTLTRKHLEENIIGEADYAMPSDALEVTALNPGSELEIPFQQVCIERKIQQGQPTTERDMQGMVSLLTNDIEQYLKEKQVVEQCHFKEEMKSCHQLALPREHSEDNVNREARWHIQTDASENTALSPRSELEIPFQEVCIERKTQQEQPKTVRDPSGMVSLLTSDLETYLKEKPAVEQRYPEEEVVHEYCHQLILPRKHSKEEITSEVNWHMHTDASEDTTFSPSSELEIPFHEIHIKRNTQQEQPTTVRDPSGMVSLLSSALETYVKEKPAVEQCHPEEEVVHESYEEVILSKDNRKQASACPQEEDNKIHVEDTNEKGALDNEWQTRMNESHRSFSSEEGEAVVCPHGMSDFNELSDTTMNITTSNETKEDVLQYTTTSQRPANLGNLNMSFDDPPQKPCQRDSLEESPLMEDESSKKSPDSLEPSPTGKSPCPDSLEGSPTYSYVTEAEMPPKTAVYEEYVSQLEACFAHGKNVDMDVDETNDGITETEVERGKALTEGESENLCALTRTDSLDKNDSKDDYNNKQLTPEEEMFKMAAKIKTFEEMEQETKTKRDISSDATAPSKIDPKGGEQDLTCPPSAESLSHDAQEKNTEMENIEIIERQNRETDISTRMVTEMERAHLQSEPIPPQLDGRSSCLTASHKCRPYSGSGESLQLTEGSEVVEDGCVNAHFSSFVMDDRHPDVVEDVKQTLASGSHSLSESQAVITTEEIEYVIPGWEDNEDIDPQVNVEYGRKSQDKTPAQTPGDECTPDQFKFEEGKLFEMTRGGAIDMTRRSYDEDGGGYAFFQLAQHPVDEIIPGEAGDNQTKPPAIENEDYTADSVHRDRQSERRTVPKPIDNSEHQTPLSETDLGSSIEVQPGSPSALEQLTSIQGDVGGLKNLGLNYLDSTIADLQSKQHNDSSDSCSDEEEEEEDNDQCSVIEMSISAAQATTHVLGQEDLHPPFEQLNQNKEKVSALNRRLRSEADGGTSVVLKKNSRSFSDSSYSKPPKPLVHASPSCSQIKEIQESTTKQPSVTLDTDDTSSASHRSLDSVIFTYDVAASHSLDSDANPLMDVHPSSGVEDVFESRPIWDDMVETQMQKIIDDETPECTPGMASRKRVFP